MKYNKLALISSLSFLTAVLLFAVSVVGFSNDARMSQYVLFLIFLFLPSASFIAGILALNQIKQTGQKGKTITVLAITLVILYLVILFFDKSIIFNPVGILF